MVNIEEKSDQNVVFIGQKDKMAYITACATQFNREGVNEIILKSRGRSMATAIDVSQIFINKFRVDAEIKDVQIGTEQVDNKDDTGKVTGQLGVSSIEIKIGLKK